MSLLVWCLLLSVALKSGCRSRRRPTPRPTHADLAQAEQVVREFFNAIEAGDCTLAGQLYDAKATREDCEEFVREWKGHGMKFLDVERTYADGRDPKAIVARVQVKKRDAPKIILLRLVREGREWKVRH